MSLHSECSSSSAAATRATALLRTYWPTNRTGFSVFAEEARWRSRALEQVERFTQIPQATGSPIALERYMEVDLTDGVRVIGRIDTIDEGRTAVWT